MFPGESRGHEESVVFAIWAPAFAGEQLVTPPGG